MLQNILKTIFKKGKMNIIKIHKIKHISLHCLEQTLNSTFKDPTSIYSTFSVSKNK